MTEQRVVWQPQSGPQSLLLSCPIDDVLYGGARGGGKTDGLLGDFLSQAAQYPTHARGLFLRRSYPELEQVIGRSREIFYPLDWTYREKDRTWYAPEGAFLRMRFLDRDSDAANYQGHDYSWIGADEAGNWPDPAPLDKIRATLRSAYGVPVKFRLSANPGGPGHGWLKQRYIETAPPMTPFTVEVGKDREGRPILQQRVFIPAKVSDNLILIQNDPTYVSRLYMVGDEALVRAWLDGDWDVPVGQYFTEWTPSRHIIPECELPSHWMRFTAMDWGSNTPFCVLWIAVADGTPLQGMKIPDGALVVYREWYGAQANGRGIYYDSTQASLGIVSREAGERIAYRVADPAMFRSDGGESIGSGMRKHGLFWRAADKERKAGWHQIRHRLKGTRYGLPDWQPMLYIMNCCTNLIRTLPLLQHAEKDPEDAMKTNDDHPPETLRYGCMSRPYSVHAAKDMPIQAQSLSQRLLESLKLTRKREQRIRSV